MNDTDRLNFLADLFKHCPTASINYDDGFIIRVEETCLPEVQATGQMLHTAIDRFKIAMERATATANNGN